MGQICRARVISPLRQHGLSIELRRRDKVKYRSRERCERTLEAGNEYGSKAKLVILRSCRRCPWSDLERDLISSGVTNSLALSPPGADDSDKGCCGSISWTVDLNRTAGPLLSSEERSTAVSGAIMGVGAGAADTGSGSGAGAGEGALFDASTVKGNHQHWSEPGRG